MADSIAWPLGKLGAYASVRCGTTVGRGRAKSSLSTTFSTPPPTVETSTNTMRAEAAHQRQEAAHRPA